MGDGTYYIGRNELLGWINTTLQLNLSKIEQTANGAVACQLMDGIFPSQFQMQKIDYNAKNEYDMINNYKVLQAFFSRKGIEKSIMIMKLVKGRPLDNMEFMQWMKAFYDKETGGMGLPDDYDAVARRQLCKTGDIKLGSTKPAAGARRPASVKGGSAARASSSASSRKNVSATPVGKALGGVAGHKSPKTRTSTGGSDPEAQERIKELTDQLTEMRLTAEESVREREFYYGKLREIEIMCQTPRICEDPIIKVIEQILYAPNEEEARQIVQKTQMEYAGQVVMDGDNEAIGDANGEANGV